MSGYKVLELATPDGQASGRFHYVQHTPSGVQPVGFCAESCPGHPTMEAAIAHYKEYLMASARYDGMWSKPCRCDYKGCLEVSLHYVQAGVFCKTLCPRHLNPTHLAETLIVDRLVHSW